MHRQVSSGHFMHCTVKYTVKFRYKLPVNERFSFMEYMGPSKETRIEAATSAAMKMVLNMTSTPCAIWLDE